MDYNNDPTTTFADIQEVFSIVERLIALRLKVGGSSGADGNRSINGEAHGFSVQTSRDQGEYSNREARETDPRLTIEVEIAATRKTARRMLRALVSFARW